MLTKTKRKQLVDCWRQTKSLRGLAVVVAFHLIFSLAGVYWLSSSFNLGKRLVLLHVSIVAGLIAVITLCLGLSLYSKWIKNRLTGKLLLSCIPAAGFAALTFLYLANYVSNARWANNFNYQILAQWDFRAELFHSGGHFLLSRSIYLSLAAGLIVIFAIYLGLSKKIFAGLEDLFLPGRRYSFFRDRRRTRFTLGLLCVLLPGFIIYIYGLARITNQVGHLTSEPIIGFFITATGSADDLNKYNALPRLREQAQRVRSEYPRNQQFSKRNVILIIVDSLRADHTQVYGYARPTTPFLLRLMESGQLKKVEFALSTCADSYCGILSTLTSRNFRSLIPEDFKLYELLYDQGYQVYFVLSGPHSLFGLKPAYGTSLTYYFDGSNSTKYAADDDRVIFEGLEQVPSYSGKPAFFFFHLMSAHFVGTKQDRYRIYNPSDVDLAWKSLFSGKLDQVKTTNYYDNGVVQADAIIEQIFQGLKEKGYLENSLVMILGDHGEGLGERGADYYNHGFAPYNEQIRIPMLIHDDGKKKYSNLKFATQTDVGPTVVDSLGLAIPSSWQGRSLLDPNIKEYSYHHMWQDGIPIRAVVYRTDRAIFKYIRSNAKEELYELVTDPREQNDLMPTAEPALIQRMRNKMAEHLSTYCLCGHLLSGNRRSCKKKVRPRRSSPSKS